jgi:3'-phosphoadenosine 5'-phosphosulfate sulfotransferase (PAPS reductase)/FAD synthetase
VNQFVAFSGGIDSTALALLEPDAIPIFTDTGWEFPELYAHIEKFERVTGRKVERPQG